ncbi:haloacid dehalogenase domain-containing protein hydrolase [Flammeovirgaceae bacterium 311]|nr:haloacid dehalogenase domain-containing protein hydrolase [Flammeovirgaceae bacterium 311]
MSFDEYWQLKRNKVNHETILKQQFNYQSGEIDVFNVRWMELIEENNWLKLDMPFEGVKEHLASLKDRGHHLYLVTARQFKDRAINQISNFGWFDLFDDYLVTEQKYDKADLIRPFLQPKEISWMVGDTGKDIQTGKLLNMKTVAVLTGFLSRQSLINYAPDQIVSSLVEFDPER